MSSMYVACFQTIRNASYTKLRSYRLTDVAGRHFRNYPTSLLVFVRFATFVASLARDDKPVAGELWQYALIGRAFAAVSRASRVIR